MAETKAEITKETPSAIISTIVMDLKKSDQFIYYLKIEK